MKDAGGALAPDGRRANEPRGAKVANAGEAFGVVRG